jgi:glycosyltransferase involved in cell wall biosynthesis
MATMMEREPRTEPVRKGQVCICLVDEGDPATAAFTRAHLEHLPARMIVVQGVVPHVGRWPVLPQHQLGRAWRKSWRVLRGRDWNWEVTSAYLRVFRRYRPAAVLAEWGPTAVRVMDACRLARLPLVAHFHGYDATMHSVVYEFQTAYRELFQVAGAIIAVSRHMEHRLIALGALPEKVNYNPYGVDCTAFGGADPSASPPTFLGVGRFVDKKAPHLTLLAFAQVYQQCAAARLRLIGDGPLLGACRDLAQAVRIDSAVTFLGAQPHGIVRDEMRRARAFVQHSIEAGNGDCEGTPVAVIEAGASGLPVVSTRHAGIPDVVVERETGFLVEERDIPGMAGRMLQLARDPGLAAALGKAGRARVEEHFSTERSIGRLWSIIENCIDGHQNGECPPLAHGHPRTE